MKYQGHTMRLSYPQGASCPISEIKVNEKIVRINAFWVILLSVIGILFQSPLLFALLGFDFGLRAFGLQGYSPIRFVSMISADLFPFPHRMVEGSPKQFSAGVGMLFCISIALFQYTDQSLAALLTGAVLLICASLESFVGYCVGCQVYIWMVMPIRNILDSTYSKII